MARELTKRYETFISGTLESLLEKVADDKDQRRGEIVIIVEGRQCDDAGSQEESADRILSILLEECSVKQATSLAVKITGLKKIICTNVLWIYQKSKIMNSINFKSIFL